MEIKEQVIDVIAHTINVENSVLTDNTAVGDIDEWDSMGNIAIISAVEETFGIEFPIEDLFELNSVASIVEAIVRIKN